MAVKNGGITKVNQRCQPVIGTDQLLFMNVRMANNGFTLTNPLRNIAEKSECGFKKAGQSLRQWMIETFVP